MAYSLIAHSTGVGTTGTIDTSGATLLVAFVVAQSGGAIDNETVTSDTKSNSWSQLSKYLNGGYAAVRINYVTNPTVGSGHNIGSDSTFANIFFAAFSGADTSSPFDQASGSGFGATSPYQPGSITPGSNNELIIAAFSGFSIPTGGSGVTVDSGITKIDCTGFGEGGTSYGGFLGYKVQTTAAAINPAFTNTGTDTDGVAAIASFKASGGGGSIVNWWYSEIQTMIGQGL